VAVVVINAESVIKVDFDALAKNFHE